MLLVFVLRVVSFRVLFLDCRWSAIGLKFGITVVLVVLVVVVVVVVVVTVVLLLQSLNAMVSLFVLLTIGQTVVVVVVVAVVLCAMTSKRIASLSNFVISQRSTCIVASCSRNPCLLLLKLGLYAEFYNMQLHILQFVYVSQGCSLETHKDQDNSVHVVSIG